MENRTFFLTDISFLQQYRESDPEARVIIMMNNYDAFPKMVNRLEKKIEYKIIAEREYLASKRRQMTDVRVQTSGTSDPTANEGIYNVMLESALLNGELDDEVLGNIEGSEEYRDAVHILKVMRRDYSLLNCTIESLSESDETMFRNYLARQSSVKDAAVYDNMSYSGFKKKISRIKKYIISDMSECLSLSFR